ncbi:hypothetical protein T484DRAFT_1613683, partial [Baffinella frigidus]
MEADLPLSSAEFPEVKQTTFREAVAAAAETDAAKVAILNITDSSGGRRLLLAASINVRFRAEDSPHASLSTATLSTELAKRGLPAVLCPKGSFAGVGGCNLCAVGSYADAAGSSACSACAVGFSSAVGSTAASDCFFRVCPVGYTGDELNGCTACGVGSYKDAAGSVACTSCGIDATSEGARTAVGNCICPAGYIGNASSGGGCTACGVGSYKDAAGSAACTTCSVGYYSAVGSTALNACIFVTCPLGYTGDQGKGCTACPSGSHKNTTGAAACTSC